MTKASGTMKAKTTTKVKPKARAKPKMATMAKMKKEKKLKKANQILIKPATLKERNLNKGTPSQRLIGKSETKTR